MESRVPSGFASDSVLLHAWRATVDDLSSSGGILDPAHMARLSCVLEAVRVVADAADADPASLRKPVVDDLRLFALRLSRDFGRSCPGGGVVVPLRGIDLSTSLVALAGVVDGLGKRVKAEGFEPRDGRVDMDRTGLVDRRAMMTWVSKSIIKSNDLDNALLSEPATSSPDTASLARDGWTLVAAVAIVATALSDNNLVEVDYVSDRLDLAESICAQAIERCGAIERVHGRDLSAARAAFEAIASVVEDGQAIVDEAVVGLHSTRNIVRWRLLSKGRAILTDQDVADLFANGEHSLDTVAPIDLATARAFGAVARSLRTDWVA